VLGGPRCEVLAGGKPYDVREMRVKDVPMGHRPLEVVWRKRRYRCGEPACPQRVFTERSVQIPLRRRLTLGLRARLEDTASRSAWAMYDVARDYGMSWWSVHCALVDKALTLTDSPLELVRMLGLDETRARSLRWVWEDDGWRLSNPWMTSFVDLDSAGLAGCSAWSRAAPTLQSRPGWAPSRRRGGTASKSARSTRRRRSPRRCAGCCRRRRSWSTTGIWCG
jgi:hypothetical protein